MFQELEHSHYPVVLNDKIVLWDQYKDPIFPAEIKPIEFRIRHAHDPIIDAVDLYKDLNFEKKTEDLKTIGILLLIISIVSFFALSYKNRKLCKSNIILFKKTE